MGPCSSSKTFPTEVHCMMKPLRHYLQCCVLFHFSLFSKMFKRFGSLWNEMIGNKTICSRGGVSRRMTTFSVRKY